MGGRLQCFITHQENLYKAGLGSYPPNYKTVNSIVSFIVIFEALFIIAYKGCPVSSHTTNSKVLSFIIHTWGLFVIHNKCHGGLEENLVHVQKLAKEARVYIGCFGSLST